jgi:hypothetical protein
MKLRQLLTKLPRSYRLVRRNGGELVAVLDASPKTASKSFWMNAAYLGIRRHRQELPGHLLHLTLIMTVNGVNSRVARQMNYLFSYIATGKLHGFLKQLRLCTSLCQLLS